MRTLRIFEALDLEVDIFSSLGTPRTLFQRNHPGFFLVFVIKKKSVYFCFDCVTSQAKGIVSQRINIFHITEKTQFCIYKHRII